MSIWTITGCVKYVHFDKYVILGRRKLIIYLYLLLCLDGHHMINDCPIYKSPHRPHGFPGIQELDETVSWFHKDLPVRRDDALDNPQTDETGI